MSCPFIAKFPLLGDVCCEKKVGHKGVHTGGGRERESGVWRQWMHPQVEPTENLDRLREELRKVREDLEEKEALFQKRWAADMRAIQRWQKAHPEKKSVWPDRTDMVFWLLEQWEKKR